MLRGWRTKDIREAYIVRRISDGRKLSPIAFLEVLRGEIFKRDILEWRFPAGHSQPGGVILRDRKIKGVPIFHHERLVIGDAIRKRGYDKQQQNKHQTYDSDPVLHKTTRCKLP